MCQQGEKRKLAYFFFFFFEHSCFSRVQVFPPFLQEAESFLEPDPDLLHPPDLQASFFPHSSFPFLQADFSFFFPQSDLPLESGQVFPSLAGP